MSPSLAFIRGTLAERELSCKGPGRTPPSAGTAARRPGRGGNVPDERLDTRARGDYNVSMDTPTGTSEESTEAPGPTRRPFRKRLWVRIVLGTVIVLVITVGPWPAYEGDRDGDYARATRRRLEDLAIETTRGAVRAGVAAVEITPPVGEPLGGYSGRRPKASDALAQRLWAKALSLSNGRTTVTIVGGDILLILPHLRDAILQRAGLRRAEVYFTATHTHSGPGGYSPRWLEQIVVGEYDSAIADRLADAFAKAIALSRRDMEPARIAVTLGAVKAGLVANRIDKTASGNGSLACLSVFGADDKPIGGLVTFNAHATCLGHRSRAISGDYPGIVQAELARRLGGTWLFAAGAVGSMKPASMAPRGPKQLEAFAAAVAAAAVQAAGVPADKSASARHLHNETGRYYLGPARTEATLACAVLAVDLPQTQFRISSGWRLSPIITSLIHARQSYIHVVRLNAMVLLGMPCDYSGELSARLVRAVGAGSAAPGSSNLIPVVTSFNGDYIGYLVPHERYSLDEYESRDANFFGPWCGEYFHDLSERIVKHVARSEEREGG